MYHALLLLEMHIFFLLIASVCGSFLRRPTPNNWYTRSASRSYGELMVDSATEEWTPFGIYKLGGHIFTTQHSVLYKLIPPVNSVDDPEVVVDDMSPESRQLVAKYSTGAQLAREFSIMSRIQELGISPKVHHLTNPVLMPQNALGAIKGMSEFVENQGTESIVQLMTMDLVGEVLEEIVQKQFGNFDVHIDRLLVAGIATINLLRKLHEAGFVHGDIHAGNIALRSPGSVDFSDLVLIDFGLAFPVTEQNRGSNHVNCILASPWHLINRLLGPRDDLYRALETIADLMVWTGGYMYRLDRALKSTNNRRAMVKIKLETPLIGRDHFLIENVSTSRYEQLFEGFEAMKRSIVENGQEPDYDFLVNTFQDLRSN